MGEKGERNKCSQIVQTAFICRTYVRTTIEDGGSGTCVWRVQGVCRAKKAFVVIETQRIEKTLVMALGLYYNYTVKSFRKG